MPIELHIREIKQEMRDGEVVKETAVSMDTLPTKNAHYVIQNDELTKLLAMPTSKMDLFDRLNRTYKRSKHQRRHSKHKHSKHKVTKKHKHIKHKKHQRSKHKHSKHKLNK
jgi:hypothetical protein